MTFPTVTAVTDEFNRADERPVTGGAWKPQRIHGGTPTSDADRLAVSSNQLIGPAVPGLATYGSQWWDEVIGPDLESRVEVGIVMTHGDIADMYARLRSAGTSLVDGYYGEWSRSGTIMIGRIFRLDNNVATQLGTTTSNLDLNDLGDWLGFECEGLSLRLYRWSPTAGWEQPLQAEDSTYPEAGKVGLVVFDAMRVERWICGTKIPQADTPIGSKRRLIGQQERGNY